jgi:hypothetical protein
MFSFENVSERETVHNASNFSEVPLTYGMMTVPWCFVSEEVRFLADSFITESTE